MRLTVQTDYALRMLMHLACRADALATIHEIETVKVFPRFWLLTIASDARVVCRCYLYR